MTSTKHVIGAASFLLLPPLQEGDSGFSIPWWVWFVLIILALLLLMIILIRQQGPGEPIPPQEEQIKAIQAEAADRTVPIASEALADDTPADDTPSDKTTSVEESIETESSEEPAAELMKEPAIDDLTRIEGIGPKTATILQEAGIVTFSQLAETDIDHLDKLLDEANLHFSDESSWPEQAKLAAAKNWDELDNLQGELNAGRRSS